MDRLFNIFQREKKRVGDRFTVYYDKERKAMRYSNSEGVLTVLFNEEKGSEHFYYKPNSAKRSKGPGILVEEISIFGHKALSYLRSPDLCPQEIIDLIHDYQSNRGEIGVEKPTDDIQEAIAPFQRKITPLTSEEIKEILADYEEKMAYEEMIAKEGISEENIINDKDVRFYLDEKSFLK